jgi:hypothetical protein
VEAFRVLLLCSAFASIAFAQDGFAIDETASKELLGCWLYDHDPNDGALLDAELLCFKTTGLASGFTSHVGWRFPYSLEGNRLVVKPWFEVRLVAVNNNELTLERYPGQNLSYRFICKTDPPDDKCRRLNLEDPASFAELLLGTKK